MGLYLMISSGLMFLSIMSFSKKNTLENNDNSILFGYISLLWIVFFGILTGFRNVEIGNDTATYVRAFENVVLNGINVDSNFEKGYIYFTYIISKITDNPHYYLIIHASICYIGLTYYIFRFSKNIMISTTLLFCVCFSLYTNILRQAIAMIICLYAYEYLKKDKKVKFLILVLFSSLLHTSALICLLLLLRKYFPKTKKSIIISCLIVLALSLSGLFLSFFLKTSLFYNGYADSRYVGTGYLGVTYYLIRAVFFIGLYYYAYEKGHDVEKSILYLLLLLTCLGYSINIFTRLSEYFVLPLIVEIPNCFYTGKLKNKEWLLLTICFIMLLYFLVTCVFRPNWNCLYPYKFWNY